MSARTDQITIGILGAGKLGVVLAQLALNAGYTVHIAGSGAPEKIRLSIDVLAPGATSMVGRDVADTSDIIILAVPLGHYKQLPASALRGKIVIDAMNYWWETDGKRDEFSDPASSTSELIQDFLQESTVVKAFNHIGYHDLHNEARPKGSSDRKGIAIAGDHGEDVKIVSNLVDHLGFDPLAIGTLEEGIKLQPGGPVFGEHVDADTLKKKIASFFDTPFGQSVAIARLARKDGPKP